MRFGIHEAHRWCMAPPRPIGPGMEWKGRGPDVMLRELTARLQKLGGGIQLGVRATRLVMEPATSAEAARCTGVVGIDMQGRERTWHGAAIVIADGGFQANADLFRMYIGRRRSASCSATRSPVAATAC
jgi:fumarate reductase flavoprotein subunit